MYSKAYIVKLKNVALWSFPEGHPEGYKLQCGSYVGIDRLLRALFTVFCITQKSNWHQMASRDVVGSPRAKYCNTSLCRSLTKQSSCCMCVHVSATFMRPYARSCERHIAIWRESHVTNLWGASSKLPLLNHKPVAVV